MALERLAQRFLAPTVERVVAKGEQDVAKKAAAEQLAGLLDRNVVAELGATNAAIKKRWPQLLAEKYKRMSEGVFAFFRGSDDLFIKDAVKLDPTLAAQPKALLQGDLHLNNLGALLKDDDFVRYGLVDFDEATAGPVLLDLRRLATSIHLVADERGLSGAQADKLVEKLAKSYHKRLGQLAEGKAKAYAKDPKLVADMIDEAMKQDAGKWLDKLAPNGPAGRMLARDAQALDVEPAVLKDLQQAFTGYRAGLGPDAARRLDGYAVADAVSAIGGVGSVGRARYRVLAKAPNKPALVFEIKEELPALVGQRLPGGGPAFRSEAERVVTLIKAANPDLNPYVGLTSLPAGDALGSTSFMVKRLYPQAASVDVGKASAQELEELIKRVGKLTADTHASGAAVGLADAKALLDALGPKKGLVSDLQQASRGYAKQVHADYKAFTKALEADPLLQLPVVRGQG
jgi:uncharacterized protein (DUF2252 family)